MLISVCKQSNVKQVLQPILITLDTSFHKGIREKTRVSHSYATCQERQLTDTNFSITSITQAGIEPATSYP